MGNEHQFGRHRSDSPQPPVAYFVANLVAYLATRVSQRCGYVSHRPRTACPKMSAICLLPPNPPCVPGLTIGDEQA